MEGPLLFMPAPSVEKRAPGTPDRRKIHHPLFPSQHKKIQPKIDAALEQLKDKDIAVSSQPDGMIPEKILVLELKKFDAEISLKLKQIVGFEWVLDYAGEPEDDPDFYRLDKKGEPLPTESHLYLSLANMEHLKKIKSIWDQYCESEGETLQRGWGKFKTLFSYLKDIRFWDTEDRLRNTGLKDDLDFKIENNIEEILVEIELWYSRNKEKNTEAVSRVKENIEAYNGSVISSCAIEGIAYQAVLAKFPTGNVKNFYSENAKDIALLTNDDVMYFNAISQCTMELDSDEGLEAGEIESELVIEHEKPVVALLDGYPLQQHIAIKDAIIIDDPDDYETLYADHPRIHGTSMASIIINGDANKKQSKLNKLYCRPIMIPQLDDDNAPYYEMIPEEMLPVDVIHRAVRRMFEGDGEVEAQANNIKIINLSIGDTRKRFDGRVSPLAKLIDWLSWKYNVLFVVSAGNYYEELDLGVVNSDYKKKSEYDQMADAVKAIRKTRYEKRLLSPAESINALTVGALNDDESGYELVADQIEPVRVGTMPSPVNPISWGVKKAVKPDILMPGGRLVYRNKAVIDSMNVALQPILYAGAPFGIKSAMPGASGALNTYGFTAGTSNATAMATRKAVFVNETLQDLKNDENVTLIDKYDATSIKALMIHGAELQDMELTPFELEDKNKRKYDISQYSGYGMLDMDRAHGCYKNQATMIRSGVFSKDEGHLHQLPLPNCLSGTNAYRKLIITLCWQTPANCFSQKYRGVKLWFSPDKNLKSENNPLQVELRELDHRQVKHGTVQHEILTGHRAMAYADTHELLLQVNCMNDGLKLDGTFEIPYTLVVTIEAPGSDLPVYEEVRNKLEEKVKSKEPVEITN